MKSAITVRITALLLLLLLVVGAAASCTEPQKTPEEGSGTAAPADTTPDRVTSDLPPMTFDGYVFSILHWTGYDVHGTDLYVEETTGDLIEGEVFKRNSRLENSLDISFEYEEVPGSEAVTKVRTYSRSNEDYYDLVYLCLAETAPVMLEGLLLDFESGFSYVDLDKPYWDQNIREELSFAHRLYLAASDINVTDKNATASLIFNKTLARDNDLPNFYDMVKDGSWTFDTFYDAMTALDGDLNGDGKMKPGDDLYGYITSQDTVLTFFYSGGGNFVQKDDEDLPYSCFSTEENYEVVDYVLDILYEPTVLCKDAQNVFINNENKTAYFVAQQGLFFWQRMHHIIQLRGEEAVDFGILPAPKYSDDQTDYRSLMSKRYSGLMSVLAVENDPDTVGYIMEAMAAASHYDLQEAYYEATLKTKSARDDESQEMLDIIFAHRVIDIGEVCDFGGFSSALAELPFKGTKNYDVMSTYATREDMIEDDILSFLDRIELLELGKQ